MKKILFVVLALILVGTNSAFALTTPNVLEGKTFVGEMGKTGESKGDPDNFIFKGGEFRSTACDEYGYTSAPFTLKSTGNDTNFEAITKNDKGARMAWKGTVKGNEIEGNAYMTTASGDPGDKYWFKGVLKK